MKSPARVWLLKCLSCLLWLLLNLSSLRAQQPPPREDHQFWHETQLIRPLTKTKDLILIGVLRTGRNSARPVDERVGAAVAFKLSPHLTVQPTLVYVDQQPYPNRRISEFRLILNVTAKTTWKGFTFTDRNLIERRARYDSRDFTVYRNRLQLDHPAHLGEFQFKPFVADEVWYSTQSGAAGRLGWYRNRVSAGIIKQFTKSFQGEFFYLYQHDGVSRPGNVHAAGTLFRVWLN